MHAQNGSNWFCIYSCASWQLLVSGVCAVLVVFLVIRKFEKVLLVFKLFHSSSDDLDGIEELSQTVVCNKKQKSNSKGSSAGIASKKPKVGGRIKSRAQDSSSSSESDLLGSPPPVANARKTDNNQVVKSNTIAGREQIPQQGITTISIFSVYFK